MSRPAANTAPADSTAGPQDIVARGRIEPLGRVIVVNAPADSPVMVLQKLLVDQGSKVKAGEELALADDYDEGLTDRLPAIAAELVRKRVDVIHAAGPEAAVAAARATKTIPIVFWGVTFPVEQGIRPQIHALDVGV